MIRDPRGARAAVDEAAAHWNRGDLGEALRCCRSALRLDPRNVDALANTATLLWLDGAVDEAERLCHAAHRLDPRHAGVLINLATLRNEAGDLRAALDWIERAASLRPRDPDVTWRKALFELAAGDYASGWSRYETGLSHASMRGSGPGFATPPWDGAPCDRLLLCHEQGFGDTVQFVRYAKACRSRARRLVVLCPAALVALVRSCPDVDDAVDTVGADGFDQHVAMLSLPHLFGTTLASVPADVPYLFADPARGTRWAGRTDDETLKVGLAWAGNFRHEQPRFRTIDRARSMPLETMAPLLALDGITFYSLQKGEAGGEARDTGIVDWMGEVDDFADTAALIAQLDLVISVDTAVVHVAGALGRPVWVLSRLDACWRWLRNRRDNPWYPTATVYGQTERGDWHAVIEAVRDDLRALAGRHAASRSVDRTPGARGRTGRRLGS